jgi:hypothetical protein
MIACQAAAGTVCGGLAQLSTLEKLLGSKIVALSAKKGKRQSKRVVVGSKSFSLAAGQTQKMSVPLNSTGKKLLARLGRLPATLTISLLNTNPPTTLQAKTTIKAKQKKKRKGHR